MELKRVYEEISRLESYKSDDSLTEMGDELLTELKYLTNAIKNHSPLPNIMQRSELLTDFMEMIEEGGMIQFDKPKLLNQFKSRQ